MMMRLLTVFACAATLAAQQATPTKIEFRVVPESRKLRPFESVVVQVKVYGKLGEKEGRLRQAGWSINVAPNDGGYLSKPFRFQDEDPEAFLEIPGSAFANIFRQVSSQYTIKDAVVYQAPAKPGQYRVEAVMGGVRGSVEFEVDDRLPAPAREESWTFGPETPASDPYRPLAEHYAPFVAQETWFDWRADSLCRSDYDNDNDGANNWDNLGKGSRQAYVYYAAIESQSHWFLIYNFFHARDYSDNCVVGTCHENDNEGVILTVRKDGSAMGKLEVLETLAHNNVYSYTSDSAIRKGAHDIEGRIVLHDGSHPVVFLEAGGHGALGGGDKKSFFDGERREWRQGTGITYVYKGMAEPPKHGMDREVGYELLPIYQHWWLPAQQESNKLFSAYYRYAPLGNRPGMRIERVGGSFRGLKHGADKAKPFWGWHDEATRRRKILATGQWAADPAYAVSRNLTFPADRPVSLEYVFNPYLGIGGEAAPAPAVLPAGSSAGTVEPVASAAGSCELEVQVDGVAGLMVIDARPRWEALSGGPPEEKNVSCTGPMPSGGKYEYRVEKRSGRGEVKMIDAAQGRVEIRDPQRGAAGYRVVIHWKPSAP